MMTVSNAANLVISASYLENSLPRRQFAALTASLGLTSHSLYGEHSRYLCPITSAQQPVYHPLLRHAVLLSWLDFRCFGMWRPYFQECAVGASGLCFALQVQSVVGQRLMMSCFFALIDLLHVICLLHSAATLHAKIRTCMAASCVTQFISPL